MNTKIKNRFNLREDLRTIRRYLQLSQAEYAERLGVSPRTITSIEAGHLPGRSTELRILGSDDFYLLSTPEPEDPRHLLETIMRIGRVGIADGSPAPELATAILDLLLVYGEIPTQYQESARCVRALLAQ